MGGVCRFGEGFSRLVRFICRIWVKGVCLDCVAKELQVFRESKRRVRFLVSSSCGVVGVLGILFLSD